MDIHVPFAWQAWRLWRWAGSGGVSCVGRERDGSDDRVEGRETVRNSLGELRWGGAICSGNLELLAQVFRTNSINAIVPKNCAPKTCQAVCKHWAMRHA